MTERGLLKGFAIVCAAALALGAMRFTTPVYATLTGAIETSVRLDERAEARGFGAKVGAPRFAKRVRFRTFSKQIVRDTDGVFAVVPVELWATSETASLTGAFWAGPSGRSYAASGRLESVKALVTGKPMQPGLPRRGLIAFEIPADEATNARLKLSLIADPRLDSRLVVEATGAAAPRIEDELDLDDGDLAG